MAKSANSKVVFVPMQLQYDVMGQLTSGSNQYTSTSIVLFAMKQVKAPMLLAAPENCSVDLPGQNWIGFELGLLRYDNTWWMTTASIEYSMTRY